MPLITRGFGITVVGSSQDPRVRMPLKHKRPESLAQLEHRAEWVIAHMKRYPGMRFTERRKAIMKALGIGKTAAEFAHKRALELRTEHRKEVVTRYLDHVVDRSIEDEEEARLMKDYRAANRIRMDTARLLGLGAPDKVEHSGGVDVKHKHDLSALTDEQLEALAAMDAVPKPPPEPRDAPPGDEASPPPATATDDPSVS